MAIEKKTEIKTPEGTAEAYLYQPSETGHWPGVINLTDFFGIREVNRERAGRLADDGYLVLMTNMYYRSKRLPIFVDGKPARGTPEFDELSKLIRGPLTPDAVRRDAHVWADFLLKHPNVKGNKLGVIGHCMTGSHAMFMAAEMPDTIVALASFHGGGLCTESLNSPHHVLPKIKAKQYYGHAVNDATIPAEQIAAFEAELKKANADAVSETYNAAHGWTHQGPAFNQAESEKAYRKMVATLQATLG